jgi:protein SCO1/2
MRAAVLAAVTGLLVVAALPVTAQDHSHTAVPPVTPRGDSVYSLSASLVDQRGESVGLDVFHGHPVLIAMFYATCRDTCPLLIADLQRIERELPPRTVADLRTVLVSFDPARDTPEVLQALARAHQVDESRWRLLRAPEDTVREIAALLGIKYRRLPDGSFSHSSVITLLDADGVILVRDTTIGGGHTALVQRLRALRPAPHH